MIDKHICIYSNLRIQLKIGVAPLALCHST